MGIPTRLWCIINCLQLQCLNPIEKTFAKIKATLRKIGARTREALWQAIAIAIDDFSGTECLSLFRSAGYAT
ncbi:transposase [Skermanella aerolata]